MRRRLLLMVVLLAPLLAVVASAGQQAASTVPITEWRTGYAEINEGWAVQDGDNLAWAQPDFDDSGWRKVDIEDIGAAKTGWRWFRLHVKVQQDQARQFLMLFASDGVYELYNNGERVPETSIRSQFAVKRPTERVFELNSDQGDLHLALRTFATASYTAVRYPLVIGISLGGLAAIRDEQYALERERLYDVVPTVAINLLLVLAGIGILALYLSQNTQREYQFLGAYLLLSGIANGIWHMMQDGILSLATNYLFADPLIYVVAIAQIEFTFSFAQRRVGRGWRLYELILLSPILLVPIVWEGHFSQNTYNLIQAIVLAPLAFILPAHLFTWYRRGNREAGWVMVPIMLTAAASVLYDFGLCSFYMGWKRFEFLIDLIPIGPIPVETSDIANVLFLLAIGVVMFFRFTRVSREQARSAAELDAAREIQRRLVPASLPEVVGYKIETAYLPAQEVGGDFYQVLKQHDGDTLVVIGDVSGKGLKAAMTGTLAIGALRALAAEGLVPGRLLARLNQEMLATQDGGFITCLCAQISPSGSVLIANAGHLSPYRSGEEVELDSGLPLGIAAGADYPVVAIQLKPGETLTLLSDGVLEARNASGELLGFARTQAISGQSAQKIAEAAQSFGQEDDITVLTLKFGAAAVASA